MCKPALKRADRVRTRNLSRRGFTLIEMLVVLGIILLLIGISVTGFSQLAKHTKTQHTKAVLEAAKAMMNEYEASAGKVSQAAFRKQWDGFDQITTIDAKLNSLTGKNYSIPPYLFMPWQEYSDRVLGILLAVPNNKAIFDKLPSEQVRIVQWPAKPAVGIDFYELLDGSGHPLCFVPSAGLKNVHAGGTPGTTGVMQSVGILHTGGTLAPNPRPFWMSFGPDNDPEAGDDNIYSFDQ